MNKLLKRSATLILALNLGFVQVNAGAVEMLSQEESKPVISSLQERKKNKNWSTAKKVFFFLGGLLAGVALYSLLSSDDSSNNDSGNRNLIDPNERTIQDIINILQGNPQTTDEILLTTFVSNSILIRELRRARFTPENIRIARQRCGIPNPVINNRGGNNGNNSNNHNTNNTNSGTNNNNNNQQLNEDSAEVPLLNRVREIRGLNQRQLQIRFGNNIRNTDETHIAFRGVPRVGPAGGLNWDLNDGIDCNKVDHENCIGHHECPTCSDPRPNQNFVQLECGHNANCLRCVRDVIKNAIGDNANQEINMGMFHCLECNQPFSNNDLNLLHLDQGVRQRIYDIQSGNRINMDLQRPDGEYIQCPAPNCTCIYFKHIDNDNSSYIKCVCNYVFCITCRLSHPHDVTCNEALDLENGREVRLPEGVKRCPQCRAQVVKISGCNHMVCQGEGGGGCGARFWWCCLRIRSREVDNDHDGNSAFYSCR